MRKRGGKMVEGKMTNSVLYIYKVTFVASWRRHQVGTCYEHLRFGEEF